MLYGLESLKLVQSAIERYLKENSPQLPITQSREFHNSKEILCRIAPAAPSKDNETSQPQPQEKGRFSIIDSGNENQTFMHERGCFCSLLVCFLCLNEFSSHDIVLHTTCKLKSVSGSAISNKPARLGTLRQNLKFKAIKLCDFKMDLIKW